LFDAPDHRRRPARPAVQPTFAWQAGGRDATIQKICSSSPAGELPAERNACVESPRPAKMDGKLLKKLDWRKGNSIWFSLRWIWILLRPAFFSLRLAWIPHGEEEIAESIYTPLFHGPETISDLAFLGQYGTVLNIGDLA
jgi:hypothetical protein